MIARNVTPEQLEQAARQVNVRITHDGGARGPAVKSCRRSSTGGELRFQLRTAQEPDKHGMMRGAKGAPYRRLSTYHLGRGEQRTVGGPVCWHGHRDFFRALYRLAPTAWIRTAFTTYTSPEQFEATYEDTDRNIGSIMQPVYASEACRCEE